MPFTGHVRKRNTKSGITTYQIIVEKESQKGIVIGKGGQKIKQIGSLARKDIESLLHKHVFLELFVKVREDWRNEENYLKEFGYKIKK